LLDLWDEINNMTLEKTKGSNKAKWGPKHKNVLQLNMNLVYVEVFTHVYNSKLLSHVQLETHVMLNIHVHLLFFFL
jgi:hypothetical protein